MTLGVDTSVIIAAVHANHPVHLSSAQWLDAAFDTHDVIVAHHSLLEAYAVLTRLPAQYRVGPSEAEMVLRETIQGNARLAPFNAEAMWNFMTGMTALPAAGGAAYDAFIIQLLCAAGAEAIVTYNVDDFRRLSPSVRITEPAELPASSNVPPTAPASPLPQAPRRDRGTAVQAPPRCRSVGLR